MLTAWTNRNPLQVKEDEHIFFPDCWMTSDGAGEPKAQAVCFLIHPSWKPKTTTKCTERERERPTTAESQRVACRPHICISSLLANSSADKATDNSQTVRDDVKTMDMAKTEKRVARRRREFPPTAAARVNEAQMKNDVTHRLNSAGRLAHRQTVTFTISLASTCRANNIPGILLYTVIRCCPHLLFLQ